jgi:hypothetical protein
VDADADPRLRGPAGGLTSPEQLPRLIDELRQMVRANGRASKLDVVYPARLPADATFDQYVDFTKRLEQFGVTWAVVNAAPQSVEATAAWLLEFGARVITSDDRSPTAASAKVST